MKNHLRAAVERFKKSKGKEEYLINPISELDAECIVELGEIFKKLNRSDLVSILNGWKYQKDEEIRDHLLQWNIDNTMHVGEKDTNGESVLSSIFDVQPRDFIKIEDESIELGMIFHYDKIMEWSDDKEKYEYGIIFNETSPEATKLPLFSNKKLFFFDIDERDSQYDRFEIYFIGQDDVNLI